MSRVVKIKKTIYITPETSGRIEYESKISGKTKQEIIEKKLSASFDSDEQKYNNLCKLIEEQNKKIISLQKSFGEYNRYLIKMLEYIWVGLHLQDIPSINSNEALANFKTKMSGNAQND